MCFWLRTWNPRVDPELSLTQISVFLKERAESCLQEHSARSQPWPAPSPHTRISGFKFPHHRQHQGAQRLDRRHPSMMLSLCLLIKSVTKSTSLNYNKSMNWIYSRRPFHFARHKTSVINFIFFTFWQPRLCSHATIHERLWAMGRGMLPQFKELTVLLLKIF